MGSDLRHCVLTLVERKSGFAIIKKLKAPENFNGLLRQYLPKGMCNALGHPGSGAITSPTT